MIVQIVRFILACKQLRTRDCHNCTFYLYAKTEPIIELSDGICFAPFLGGYPEQAAHMKSANLDPSYNLWWGVFDFNDEFKTLNHWKYLDEKAREAVVSRAAVRIRFARVRRPAMRRPCLHKRAATSAVAEA